MLTAVNQWRCNVERKIGIIGNTSLLIEPCC